MLQPGDNQNTTRILSIRHALTVEGVMRYFARELGYGADEDFGESSVFCTTWILKKFPDSTARKNRSWKACTRNHSRSSLPRLRYLYRLKTGAPDGKILFACDELTGLIGAAL